MFRPLRRKKRAITDEKARELLATCKRGVFASNGDDGYPYAIPVNYFFDAEHDKIYFHGAKAGHKSIHSGMMISLLYRLRQRVVQGRRLGSLRYEYRCLWSLSPGR